MCSIVRVWPQCWQAVGGPRDKIWDFVALVCRIRSRVITTSSALVRCRNLLGGPSVSFRRYRSLPCIDTSHLIGPPVEWKSWPVASNLQSGRSLVGLCHGQGSPLLAGPLSHSPLCHNGLAPSRSGHKCLCRSMPRGDSWYGKWEGCQYLRLQLPASKTLSQSRLRHRAVQDPCADNSSVPMWSLLPQPQRYYCYLGVFWIAGDKSSHHSGNGGWWPLLPKDVYHSFYEGILNLDIYAAFILRFGPCLMCSV